MPAPIALVTGVHPDAMAVLTVALQWDLPRTVAVRHVIHVDRQVLERVVSDVTGVVERTEIALEHACVTCAVREDVVPTLRRLASAGRWESVVAHLPVGADARQVCLGLADDAVAAHRPRVASVLVGVDAGAAETDLVGDDLLRERGLHASTDDGRGVAEVLARLIEYADATVLVGGRTTTGVGLVETLARPGSHVLADVAELDARRLVGDGRHRPEDALAWVAPDRRGPLPDVTAPGVWRVDLRSDRPFHPDRLLADIARLGGWPHRSRGCFWLPTRPDRMCAWDGAGGQLSIGVEGTWQRARPHTRIVITGTGPHPPHLADAFESLLVTEPELGIRGTAWEAREDGFEPWLGPVRRAA
jgi:G3E family GTPase